MRLVLFFLCMISSTLATPSDWGEVKRDTIAQMANISGWCEQEKAILMMDLIKEHKFECCIEIGVFAGKSLLPIINALRYNNYGHVFGIDAWSAKEATKGFSKLNPHYSWWNSLDYRNFYQQTITLVKQIEGGKYCSIVKQTSQDALSLFKNDSIDFIHIDGSHGEEEALQDVKNYFPKIKNGGYILLNDCNWFSMKSALIFLMERTETISSFSPSATYLLLRKTKKRVEKALMLMND